MRTLLGLSLVLCTTCADTTADPSDGSVQAADAPAGKPLYELTSTALPATVVCDDAACDVFASDVDVPTRVYSRGRADGSTELVFDGYDLDTLYWATRGEVRRIDTGAYADMSRPRDGRVWLANASGLIQLDALGRVWRTIEPPVALSSPFVDVVGDSVVFGGYDEVAEAPRVWRHDAGASIEMTPESFWVADVVAINDQYLLFLGYGYYHVWHINDGDIAERGGSDDQFDRAVRCGPDSYWVGGGTGITAYCDDVATCSESFFHSPHYHFQVGSVGCVGQSLWSLFDGELRETTPALVETTSEVDWRHLWTDLGFAWRIRPPR